MEFETLVPILIVVALCFVGIIITIIISGSVLLPFLGFGLWAKSNTKKVEAMQADSQTWPAVKGKVVKSRVEVSGTEYTTVSPHIVYKYAIGGNEYQSQQVRIGDQVLTLYSSRDCYDLVELYPVGTEVDVYYDPRNPAQSALER